jgi:hypothetical protein
MAHGRVSMLAVIGFLVGLTVEGSSFLFDASVKGPAITHIAQVPAPFWVVLVLGIDTSRCTVFRQLSRPWSTCSRLALDCVLY